MTAKLILEDGSVFLGKSYGAYTSSAGEAVFATGMMGYPESLTDPSYKGQILILTYPLVGNYGVPDKSLWESDHIMVSGLVVSSYIDTPSHFQSQQTLAAWCRKENVPLVEIKDTRFLTQYIREKGACLGKIVCDEDVPFYDPNKDNLIDQVTTKTVQIAGTNPYAPIILLIDCGAKRNIQHALLRRGVTVITVPWNFNPFIEENIQTLSTVISNEMRDPTFKPNRQKVYPAPNRKQNDNLFDALLISNGPGDPKMAKQTIKTIQRALTKSIPILGICLGHQLLALAAGGNTQKLKYGHRSQNQPCIMEGSNRCFITTQNHGFAVSDIPKDFKPWFTNANDNSNEGIIHKKLPIMSVQFHPEATPSPEDAEWIFDYFLKKIL